MERRGASEEPYDWTDIDGAGESSSLRANNNQVSDKHSANHFDAKCRYRLRVRLTLICPVSASPKLLTQHSGTA